MNGWRAVGVQDLRAGERAHPKAEMADWHQNGSIVLNEVSDPGVLA
jgi:hypothetical protein